MAGVGAPPVGRTSFVGRRAELREIRNLLARSRLVTLTGTGGVGKTRLAWRTAEQVGRSYPDGVYLVQLAPLRSPALLTRTVCGAFGLLEDHEEPVARLADFLEHKRVLLVLDNCEHLREAMSLLHEPEDMSSVITARSVSAICHAWLGELETAERFADEALKMCTARGELWCRSEASCGKALVHWFRGEYEQAKLDLHTGLLVARQFRDVMKAAMLCELMAWVLAANGEAVRAAEVFGIADRMWPLVGGNPMLGSPLWIQRHEACVTVTKEALGAERFAEGLTNREIATNLAISQRTVAAHVDHVLTRLGFTSRTQIAVWVVGRR